MRVWKRVGALSVTVRTGIMPGSVTRSSWGILGSPRSHLEALPRLIRDSTRRQRGPDPRHCAREEHAERTSSGLMTAGDATFCLTPNGLKTAEAKTTVGDMVQPSRTFRW
jgi:hypothetical protein